MGTLTLKERLGALEREREQMAREVGLLREALLACRAEAELQGLVEAPHRRWWWFLWVR
jgi:hypothetical protein